MEDSFSECVAAAREGRPLRNVASCLSWWHLAVRHFAITHHQVPLSHVASFLPLHQRAKIAAVASYGSAKSSTEEKGRKAEESTVCSLVRWTAALMQLGNEGFLSFETHAALHRTAWRHSLVREPPPPSFSASALFESEGISGNMWDCFYSWCKDEYLLDSALYIALCQSRGAINSESCQLLPDFFKRSTIEATMASLLGIETSVAQKRENAPDSVAGSVVFRPLVQYLRAQKSRRDYLGKEIAEGIPSSSTSAEPASTPSGMMVVDIVQHIADVLHVHVERFPSHVSAPCAILPLLADAVAVLQWMGAPSEWLSSAMKGNASASAGCHVESSVGVHLWRVVALLRVVVEKISQGLEQESRRLFIESPAKGVTARVNGQLVSKAVLMAISSLLYGWCMVGVEESARWLRARVAEEGKLTLHRFCSSDVDRLCVSDFVNRAIL